MNNIRSIIGIANDKVLEGDFQGAISYFETAFTESQRTEYIGGLFCSSKRLGDIYYYTNCMEHAIKWYEYADSLIKEDYLVETVILQAATHIWEHALFLCNSNPAWSEKATYYKQKLETQHQTTPSSGENYETLIKRQENENKLYDNFFNSCRKNSLRLVLRYVHKGVDVNRINPQTKYTALHNACWRGHKDVVCVLLRHGADIHILNGEGETSIQCAEVAQKPEIVDLLKRVEKEGIGFLGPCAECQRQEKKE